MVRNRITASTCCGVMLSLILCACGALPGPPTDRSAAGEPPQQSANYAQLAGEDGRVYRFDPAASRIRIYAFRGGEAARLGHNHVVYPVRFSAQAFVPAHGMNRAQLDLEFRLDELELDAPAERAALGPAFAAVLDEADIARTREHMLGDANLQAVRFPLVRVHALEITGEPPKLAARLQIELHGERHAAWVAVNATCLPERLCLAGALVIRQSDFGIRPYTALGGLLGVQDALVLDFRLVGRGQ
jgi:hypothetical protein